MKLFRYGMPGCEKPGVVDKFGRMVSVADFVSDYDEDFFSHGGIKRLKAWLELDGQNCLQVPEGSRLGPCVARPSKIICVGLNYAKHAEETNAPIPSEPILFFKSTTSLCGPFDDVIIPKGSLKTDWEVELAVIIGKKASYVDVDNAMNHVAGYSIHNDYSERAFQLERNGQWVKGKSADTFGPLGPYLVTTDAIADPHNLTLWLSVNGKRMQDSNTSDMIFKIPFLVSYISQFMTLLPGDVISTGTPFGVGLGAHPPVFLQAGDVVELEVQGLGRQKQNATNYIQTIL